MSEEQFSAFLESVKSDIEMQDKLKETTDLDTAVAIALDAGFDVTKADWLEFQAKQVSELSDEELEIVSGGTHPTVAVGLAVVIYGGLAPWFATAYGDR
jgi:predicted ribosomally synthesized peptide with nif11-like leader